MNNYFHCALAVVVSLCALNSAGAQQTKPNVIIINVDDLGYGDVGCYGATKVKTPNIDQLAKEGRRFTDFHSASAVCSPSRYALITGRYPSRRNLWGPIFFNVPLVIDTSQTTIAGVMKKSGYATAAIGKWHLGFGTRTPINWNRDLKPGPLELAFDHYFGVPILNSHAPFVYVEDHKVVGLTPTDTIQYGITAETREFPEKFQINALGGGKAAHFLYDDRMVGTTLKNKAIDWIKTNKRKPFFLYYATTNIHHPFTPAPQFIGTSGAGPYGDFIHELDWIVGEIMTTLKQEGLENNTLLILTSDNGGMLNQGGQAAWNMGHRQNGALFGFKFDAWEGGHRVPFIARWPGKIPAGSTSDELLCNVDLMATMAALVSYSLKPGEGPDSYNGLPALTGKPKKPIRDFLVISPAEPANIAIRRGKWMYISAQNGGGFGGTKVGEHTLGSAAATLITKRVNTDIEDGKVKPGAPRAQLYNLESDPAQAVNVYNKYPVIVKEMRQLLKDAIENKQSTRPL
ncbi:arylsulfatase [Mucilaginibacter hurinus]|uniref:Arylsulfatase n=1 Tax=Mucilaginibacter hurinus TaxID=2201324 RepID=A0A367GQ28_9SPHI|nr:arylsulfatase [Mucilaginibacter hurinus]RCH55562.1 arylsulfatase [Mucilaginibacter hurinus]